MNERKAVCCVLLSGALWGIISIFVKGLTAAGMNAIEITLVRAALAAAAMLLVLLVRGPRLLKVRPRDLWMFFGTGVVSLTLFNLCYFTAMQQSEVSIAVVLLYTSPVFVMLLSALLFRERITGRKLLALVMTLCGSVLVAGILGGGYRLTWQVLLLGLASGLFYALYSIFGAAALKRYDTMTITFYTMLFALAAAFCLCDVRHVWAVSVGDGRTAALCLGIGAFCTVLPYLFYTWGLNGMEAGKAAILATVEPLVGALVGILLYRETVSAEKLCGMALIFGSVILLNLPGRIKVKNP